MAENSTESDLLFRQYSNTRDEIQKSIFIQYEVIKIGTTFLSALLVGIPTAYAYLKLTNLIFLSLSLLTIAFLSMSFVFIMGAGEIRIMRAASFCNVLISDLLKRYQPETNKELIWDCFVSKWNGILNKNGSRSMYKERIYLAMPFIIIAVLADIGVVIVFFIWLRTRIFSVDEILLSIFLSFSLIVQLWLYFWPARLSRNLEKASIEMGTSQKTSTDAS